MYIESKSMDVIIRTLHVHSININLDNGFSFDIGIENYSIEQSFNRDKEGGINLFIKYKYSLLSQKDKSTLGIEITTAYNLYPIQRIESIDIYTCIQQSQLKLGNVATAIFGDTENTLPIEHPTYKKIESEIDGILAKIRLLF